MPPQLEKNHVVPTSWQDEALARHGRRLTQMGCLLQAYLLVGIWLGLSRGIHQQELGVWERKLELSYQFSLC